MNHAVITIPLADRLLLLRRAQRWTQEEVAERLGIDRSTYSYYERGRSRPSYENLLKISSLYQVSCDYLLGKDRLPPPWNRA
jgi:HTH-type transcriptional regulator immR